ncbi:MAG: heavy metal translocating P-type ATPase [Longicatena sp.]
MELKYKVIGMHCSACSASVEKIVRKQPFVEEAQVNLLMEELVITCTKGFDEHKMIDAIQKAGFALENKINMQTLTFDVSGMSCAACSASVERILKKQSGVIDAVVNLLLNQVRITFQENKFDEWAQAIEKAGFVLHQKSQENTSSLLIEGMHCAACATQLEKTLLAVHGVHCVDINPLTNMAHLTYDTSIIKLSEIRLLIERAGYQASLPTTQVNVQKDYENIRIYVTLGIASVLLYIGMSHMLGPISLPLPNVIHYRTNPINFALIQFVLATLILIAGHSFFSRGLKALWHKSPNMDTLVALGTGSAYIYSCYSLFMLLQGDVHSVHALYFESAGVVVALVQFGKHLEAIAKKKSTNAISALLQLKPSKTLLYRDGQEIEIALEEVNVGDTLIIKAGEHIAVDGTIQKGSANIDESMLTGESMPVHKQVGDVLIQGTLNLDGRLYMLVSATKDDTTLAKIIKMVEEAQSKKAPIARIADKISLYFVPTVMSIAFVSALLWYLYTNDTSFALTIFVSVMVIACPCALGLATPTAIMVGTGKAAQFGIFIKSGEALETASDLDTIVFDKTGTITIGKPVVNDIEAENITEVLLLASSLEAGSKHPLALAICNKAQEYKIEVLELEHIQTHNGKGLSSQYKGMAIYVGNRFFMEENKVDTSIYEERERKYLEQGKSVVWVAQDTRVLGILGISDRLKDNVKETIARLKTQHLDVIMMSGDNLISAQAIAKEAGIEHVIAQVLPQEKGEQIKKLQEAGKRVGMVGDGINDAIALTQSDVGIAIGSGSDVALESADIVLMKDNIADVESAIRLSKAVLRNIHQNLFWAFFYNSLGIPIAAGVLHIFGGPLLSPVFAGAAMAFSSVSVVSNALRLRKFK